MSSTLSTGKPHWDWNERRVSVHRMLTNQDQAIGCTTGYKAPARSHLNELDWAQHRVCLWMMPLSGQSSRWLQNENLLIYGALFLRLQLLSIADCTTCQIPFAKPMRVDHEGFLGLVDGDGDKLTTKQNNTCSSLSVGCITAFLYVNSYEVWESDKMASVCTLHIHQWKMGEKLEVSSFLSLDSPQTPKGQGSSWAKGPLHWIRQFTKLPQTKVFPPGNQPISINFSIAWEQ